MALVFPDNPIQGQLYPETVTQGQPQWVFNDGWNLISTAGKGTPVNIVLNVYSLAVSYGNTGALDLKVAQTKVIANNTNTAKNLVFTNPPSARSMTVVIEVVGNAGTIAFPPGARLAAGVDASLSAVRTFFVLFWNGTNWNVMSNTKMQS